MIPFVNDPILFMNLILCIIILILGIVCTRRSGEFLPIYIGAAFGFFGISHAATLIGLKDYLVVPLIIIRFCAYLLVVLALFRYLHKTLVNKEAQQAWLDYYTDDTGITEKE